MTPKLQRLVEAGKRVLIHEDTPDDALQEWEAAMAEALAAQPQGEPYAWAVSGLGRPFYGEFAEDDARNEARRIGGTAVAFPLYTSPQPARKPLTDEQIEKGREFTFSTNNPFCPCDSKTMRKAVRWAERAHGIGEGA